MQILPHYKVYRADERGVERLVCWAVEAESALEAALALPGAWIVATLVITSAF
jgi:hypothetical protein